MTPRTIAKKIAQWAYDKKAEDILVLDMRTIANFCDYFVICTTNNERHLKAIAGHVIDELDACGLPVTLKSDMKKSPWIVIDIGDVVIHVFEKGAREFYRLERLWQEAKPIPWEPKSVKE
ncbi:MAG: ribosome silencing factor [Candidatus Omnitrophica bacterium]|nr:ribosome silencing factor [Candidatus Omnitrophota bacterium]